MRRSYDSLGEFVATVGSASETMTDLPPSWRDFARCKGDYEPFFDDTRWDEARALCRSCDVRYDCLEDAIAERRLDTFRAGFTPNELVKVARAARRRRA